VKVLSGLAAADVITSIQQGEVERLVRIPGVGKKTAERLVPELRDKMPVSAGDEPRGALSADAATGSIVGPLGRSEIQEAAQAFAQGDALGRSYLETRSEVVGALADGCATGLHGGSRMSREVQVRF
jgi:helix-hairpin-helix protein